MLLYTCTNCCMHLAHGCNKKEAPTLVYKEMMLSFSVLLQCDTNNSVQFLKFSPHNLASALTFHFLAFP